MAKTTVRRKRPTTIRMTPEIEAAAARYTAENETNLSQVVRLSMRRFLEGQGYLALVSEAAPNGAAKASP